LLSIKFATCSRSSNADIAWRFCTKISNSEPLVRGFDLLAGSDYSLVSSIELTDSNTSLSAMSKVCGISSMKSEGRY